MKTHRLAITIASAILVLIALAIGCSRRDGGETETNAQVVDMELMAFLSEARALPHQANLKEEQGDLAGAASTMDRLVHARRPHDGKAPEVQEVLADAYARLGELELRQNALARAGEATAAGLAFAPEPTYFRGHLVEVQGLVEEARAADLADAGKTTEAHASRERAIRLLEDVVRIQDQVIQRSLAARDAQAQEAGR